MATAEEFSAARAAAWAWEPQGSPWCLGLCCLLMVIPVALCSYGKGHTSAPGKWHADVATQTEPVRPEQRGLQACLPVQHTSISAAKNWADTTENDEQAAGTARAAAAAQRQRLIEKRDGAPRKDSGTEFG